MLLDEITSVDGGTRHRVDFDGDGTVDVQAWWRFEDGVLVEEEVHRYGPDAFHTVQLEEWPVGLPPWESKRLDPSDFTLRRRWHPTPYTLIDKTEHGPQDELLRSYAVTLDDHGVPVHIIERIPPSDAEWETVLEVMPVDEVASRVPPLPPTLPVWGEVSDELVWVRE